MVEGIEDRDLVEKAREGDREAFAQLATVFRGRLRASIQGWMKFQFGPKLDVEDILQETLLRAYRGLARFERKDSDSFFRWLCGIAKRTLAQAAEDARRTERPVNTEPQTSRPSPAKVLQRNERFDRLEAALAKLSPEHRQAILLCRIEGLTSAEVAVRMNRSPAAVRQLLVRALRELKKNFGDTESLHLPDRPLQLNGEHDGG